MTKCPKCGGMDILVCYIHKHKHWDEPCGYEGEHLHHHCRSCQYDETGPTNDAKEKDPR